MKERKERNDEEIEDREAKVVQEIKEKIMV
jgi:hypothetical protein